MNRYRDPFAMTDRLSLKNDRERYNPLLDITLKVFLSTAVTFFCPL